MNKSLDVWIVDPANLTPFYSLALGRSLADQGDRVRFVTSRFSYDPDMALPDKVAVDLHYFRGAERWDAWGLWARRGYRALRYPLDHRSLLARMKNADHRPDVVHLQWSRLPIFDRRFVERLKRLGVKVVHTVHDVEPLYEGATDMSGLGRVYASCDGLIVHTEANRRDLLERYPAIDVHKIRVIPHGPLQAEDCPANATQASARSALGIADDARVALNFGSIKPYKGLDLLVTAMPMVADRVPRCFLLLAGRPAKPSDAPDLGPVISRGISYRADFEFIANKDAWKYYLAADVVVLPYRNITQSGVLLSSMAFGKAAIVTAVGGLPEVVRAGETGWVVPPENPQALAQAMTEAFTDIEGTRRMGVQARDEVDRKYSWSSIAAETHRLYESL